MSSVVIRERRDKVKQLKVFASLSFRLPFSYAVVLVAMMFATSSVAFASGDIRGIQQVASTKVSDCKFLGDVQGFSGWGKAARRAWANKAKHQALRKADDLGATHVVWTRLPKRYGSDPYAYGGAYYCDDVQELAHRDSSTRKSE